MQEAELLLDKGALSNNLTQLLTRSKLRKIFPVIKANAYGHGMVWVARQIEKSPALHNIPFFCVARFSEASTLRRENIQHPILILSFYESLAQLDSTFSLKNVEIVLSDAADFAKIIDILKQRISANLDIFSGIHLNINTGMNRLGFSWESVSQKWPFLKTQLGELKKLGVSLTGLMTHFASGEEPIEMFSHLQLSRFKTVFKYFQEHWDAATLGSFPRWIHCENSGALLRGVGDDENWLTACRPGIALWGAYPHKNFRGNMHLEPVMQIRAPLRQMFWSTTGTYVGYSSKFRCDRETLVGTLAIGYADGVPRSLSRTHVNEQADVGFYIEKIKVPVIGIVSMDLLSVDLTDHPLAPTWSEMILKNELPKIWAEWIGPQQSVDCIAQATGTISYEIFCRVGSRLQRREAMPC